MPLIPGTRIGGCEIVALIGAGGMGEVYRARDQRLGREVAIKVLSSQIAADADAIARFEREARALAALNHPNIAAIYGVEDNAAQPALILEYVDGETLAERLAQGPVPIATAIEYAKQIADALDAAHEAGIVHRDLKPANIKIAEDGRIKVLDFGLAKAIAIAAGESPDLDPANTPTITVHGTKHGVILGTAAYMSPEQARGKRVDKRTDIWAFGCVLFEMLTGRRAFGGETTSDVIAAIIERAPNLAALPPNTPSPLRDVIARCLEKDLKRRARDIGDVRAQLDAPALPVMTTASPRRWSPLAAVMGVVAVIAIAAAGMAWRARPGGDSPAPIALSFVAPPGYSLGRSPAAVPSPDARYIAFTANDEKQVRSLFVRALDTGEVRHLDGTDGVINAPAWAPDGRSLAFFVNSTWKRVGVEGGPALTIVAGVPNNLGASWGPGDVLLTSTANRTSLSRVQATGGALQPVTALAAGTENSHRWPQLLPDGKHFLFTVRSDQPERLGIKLGALDSTEVRLLVNVASPGIYTDPGWLLFTTPDEVLMAQRLDPATWTIQGTAQPVVGPVLYNGPSFSGLFAASRDGRLLTYVSAPRGTATLQWFDPTGRALESVGPQRAYRGLSLSRDGRLAAIELADEHLGTRDLWLLDLNSQALTRLTQHPATDWRAIFSPDGGSLAFASDRAGASSVFVMPAQGGKETLLFRSAGGGAFPVDWSSDGKYVLVHVDGEGGRTAQTLLVPADGASPIPLIDNEHASSSSGRFSPDSDRIVFTADADDARNVYVMSIRDRRTSRVSVDGGSIPMWGSGGREIFYLNNRNEMMRVAVDGNSIGKPERAFTPCASVNRVYGGGPTEARVAITADGKRFLISCDPADATPSAINVLVNWQTKLKH